MTLVLDDATRHELGCYLEDQAESKRYRLILELQRRTSDFKNPHRKRINGYAESSICIIGDNNARAHPGNRHEMILGRLEGIAPGVVLVTNCGILSDKLFGVMLRQTTGRQANCLFNVKWLVPREKNLSLLGGDAPDIYEFAPNEVSSWHQPEYSALFCGGGRDGMLAPIRNERWADMKAWLDFWLPPSQQ